MSIPQVICDSLTAPTSQLRPGLTHLRLVGADGQWSRTRSMMIGRDTPDPMHFLRDNVYIGYYTIPKEMEPGEKYDATVFLATGGRMVFSRRSDPHRIQVYFEVLKCGATERLARAHRGGVAGEKAALAEIFRGAGWRVDEFLRGLEGSDDFYMERLGVVRLDSWSEGRVALVGDAAHCPSAATGMGTTSAMVGTYILAGEIERHCGGGPSGGGDGLAVALREYDSKLRPFVTKVQEGVVEGNRFFDLVPTSRLGIAVFQVILRLVMLLRLMPLAGWFFQEDGGDEWKLPEYDEMLGKA